MIKRLRILTALAAAVLLLALTAPANAPFFNEAAGGEAALADLRWKKIVIPVAFSNSLLRPHPAIRPDSDVAGAVKRSLAAWEAAANIEFQVTWTDKQSVSPAGNLGDGLSLVTIAQTPENLAVFAGDSADVSARTRIFFNRRGVINEADVVLNPYQQFSTDGAIGTFDLESTLTHEIGHLLGLEHAVVTGATMNEFQGKNGVYNVSGFSPRTLGEDDVAAVRAVYGARPDETECCGALEGRLTPANGKALKNYRLWLEAKETGRVVRGLVLAADGAFRLGGVSAGRYRVYAQEAGDTASEDLGEVEIGKGRPTLFHKKLAGAQRDFDVEYIGFNGQLANLAVPVNGGKTFQIYIGGKNLDPDELTIASTSPFVSVVGERPTRLDYGRDLSVLSFMVEIAEDAPLGEYSLYLQNKEGKADYLVGALTVERFSNPWNTFVSN